MVQQQVAQPLSCVTLHVGRHAVRQAFRQGSHRGVVARSLEIAWGLVAGWERAATRGATGADPKTDAAPPTPVARTLAQGGHRRAESVRHFVEHEGERAPAGRRVAASRGAHTLSRAGDDRRRRPPAPAMEIDPPPTPGGDAAPPAAPLSLPVWAAVRAAQAQHGVRLSEYARYR